MQDEGLSYWEAMQQIYHRGRLKQPDKYAEIKEQIACIFHENKGRYGYGRVKMELHNRSHIINHKTVQWLMKEAGLVCRERMKKYRSYEGEVGKIGNVQIFL